MGSLALEKYRVYRVGLPVQCVTRSESGRTITVTGTEQHGAHRCVVVSVDPNNQFAVVVPLTSAQDEAGGEKWSVIPKTWHRLFHDNRPVYALCEQIRYADRGRFYDAEAFLGEFDQQKLDLKLRAMLGFI
jgi:mRNA-degrading endonuclease toxin of MazEF toxin-antitoxin module